MGGAEEVIGLRCSYGAAVAIIGFIMFAYGYWQAKFGGFNNRDWRGWLIFTSAIGGIAIFMYGVYLLAESPT